LDPYQQELKTLLSANKKEKIVFDFLMNWYKKRFNDPQAIVLFIVLTGGFSIIYFFHHILTPLLVAIVIAYLLDPPTRYLQKIGVSRTVATCLVFCVFTGLAAGFILIVMPTVWKQTFALLLDSPRMLKEFHASIQTLLTHYPSLIDLGLMDMVIENLRSKFTTLSDSLMKYSLASLIGLATLAVYLVLVPLIVFFLLKDKTPILSTVSDYLPKEKRLINQVCEEMNRQITNYIRGKVIEMVIVGLVSYIVFFSFNLNYAVLLAVLVGFSVLIPYIGAVIVTVPVILVGLFQFGLETEFWLLVVAYLVVQALDGNLLVPLLFSEAVSLHPLVIILSVIIFGGLLGFWGVFFAIPLASLVKTVIEAWPKANADTSHKPLALN
jgi:putative permease